MHPLDWATSTPNDDGLLGGGVAFEALDSLHPGAPGEQRYPTGFQQQEFRGKSPPTRLLQIAELVWNANPNSIGAGRTPPTVNPVLGGIDSSLARITASGI